MFLFAAAGADIQYIFTGRRSSTAAPVPPINMVLLQQIIEAVEGALEKKRRSISTNKKAELIALIYEHFQEEGRTDDAVVQRFLKLVA